MEVYFYGWKRLYRGDNKVIKSATSGVPFPMTVRRNRNKCNVNPALCFLNPKEVHQALVNNSEVKKWLDFISNHYTPPTRKILLIYPCSKEKPYYNSRSYKKLFKTLQALGDLRKEVHLVTISEPFGIVPEEFYGKKCEWHDWEASWYECPGLMPWWCNKYGQTYSVEIANECINILADYVAKFLIKAKCKYSHIIAFVRSFTSNLHITDGLVHRKILERASYRAAVPIKVLPPREIVSEIVEKSGRYGWDMQGVAHPIAQNYLLRYLRGLLE